MDQKVQYTIDDYYDGADLRPKDSFRISPSGVAEFFSEKTQWYRENLLGEPKKFTGSTSTVLGTVVHFVAETVAACSIHNEEYNSDKLRSAIEDYISKFDDDEAYDTSVIRNNWEGMVTPLIQQYVLPSNTVAVEQFIQYEIIPGIWVAGTMDAITSSFPTDKLDGTIKSLQNAKGVLTVRDWKTSSKLPSSFSYAYKLQAYTYCYILHQLGVKVANAELCFTVRPTKTLPVRTKHFTVEFNDQAYNFIEGILKLIAESVQCFKDYEDLQYLLAADYRLKKNEIPRP